MGANQTKVDEFLASVGDTMWVQRQTSTTPFSGTQVTLNDTAPTTDRWNLAAIEVLPAVTDTQAPTAPTNLAAGTVTPTQVPLSWTASTDDQGVAGYRILRGASQVGEVTGTSFTDTTVKPSTSYTYTVKAYDAGGNESPASEPLSVTTPAGDTTPPTVSLTAPTEGATLSGTANLTATASDASGIAGVQFLLDGSPVGAEDTSDPYGLAWDSTTAANGSHTLAARARDGSGNTATSAAVTVTVTNGGVGPDQVGQWGPLIPLPAVAIHSALLPNGRILLFQGDFSTGGQQYVLDPLTGVVTHVPDAAADLFCAGQAVLADGRVLIVGGTATNGGLGVPDITAFDWQSQSWSVLAPMRYARWYATGTTLADGKVLVTSGVDRNAGDIVADPRAVLPEHEHLAEPHLGKQVDADLPLHLPAARRADRAPGRLRGPDRERGARPLDEPVDDDRQPGHRRGQHRELRAGSLHQGRVRGRRRVLREFAENGLHAEHERARCDLAADGEHGIPPQLPQPHAASGRDRPRDRRRDRQIGVRRRQRRAAGRGLESIDRSLDDLRGDERPAPLPLGCRASARWSGLRGGRRRRPRRHRPAQRPDLLPAVPLQGPAPDDRLGARDRPVRLESIRRHPRRRLDRPGLADQNGLGHPLLR